MSGSELRKTRDYFIRQRGVDPDECRRKAHLDKKFGAGTYDQVVKWNSENDCRCMICEQPEEVSYYGIIKHLMVDHDHKTGRVRGLLCSRCNLALGHFQDSLELINRAIIYLECFDE